MTAFHPTRRVLLKGAASAALAAAAAPALAKIVPAEDAFIEKLIKGMSLEEKAGQLSIFSDPNRFDGPPINPTSDQLQTRDKLFDDIAHGRMTGVFNGIGVAIARDMQKTAIERSPSKIPLIFAADP